MTNGTKRQVGGWFGFANFTMGTLGLFLPKYCAKQAISRKSEVGRWFGTRWFGLQWELSYSYCIYYKFQII
jgi:hypothetical protein